MTTFADKLRLALRGWTKAEIDRRSGITQRTINNWLKGNQPEPASIRALRKIGVRI